MNRLKRSIAIGFAKSIIPALGIVAMIDYAQTKPWAAYLGLFAFIFGFMLNELIFAKEVEDE